MGTWTNPNTQQVVPIVQSGSLAGGSVAATITPAGGLAIVSLANVSAFGSYDLTGYLYASTPGAAASPIVALIQLEWYDDTVSGIPVFEEQWWVWVGRVAAAFSDNLGATGPMHGQYMSVNISIPVACASNAILQYFNLFGSPRTTSWSDWRQDAFQVNPQNNGLTLQSASTSGYENSLCNAPNIALGAGASVWIPCALYAGPCYYRFQANAAPQNNVIIAAADNITASGVVIGTGNTFTLVNITADTLEHEGTFIAPRAPCYMSIHGNAAASVFSFNMTGQQAA